MKIVDGEWNLAISKMSFTIRSASPRYLEASVLDVSEKKVVPHSVATAFASSVLPVPGGPNMHAAPRPSDPGSSRASASAAPTASSPASRRQPSYVLLLHIRPSVEDVALDHLDELGVGARAPSMNDAGAFSAASPAASSTAAAAAGVRRQRARRARVGGGAAGRRARRRRARRRRRLVVVRAAARRLAPRPLQSRRPDGSRRGGAARRAGGGPAGGAHTSGSPP